MRLLGTPRNFPELPERWDGDQITWEKWSKHPKFSHVDAPCDRCELNSSLWSAVGWYVRSTFGSEWKRRGMRNFHATRCGWCGHTTVFTMHDKQSWELDDADYGEHGSYDIDEQQRLF